MTLSYYYVYEKLNNEYKEIGFVLVDDGEHAKKKAIEKYYPDNTIFRPSIRVSTKPLTKQAHPSLMSFFKDK